MGGTLIVETIIIAVMQSANFFHHSNQSKEGEVEFGMLLVRYLFLDVFKNERR